MNLPVPGGPGLSRRDALALFALALGLRLILIVTTQGDPVFRTPMLDAEYAVDWARAIGSGDVFGSPEGTAYFRTPLYAWFLAGSFLLPGNDLVAARVVQAFLGAAVAVMLALVSARHFGRTAGLATGALAALSWPLLLFGRELLIAPLVVFLGSTWLWIWDGADRRSGALRFAVAGAVLGLGAVARPNFLALAPVALALAAFQFGREGRARRALAVLAGLIVVLAPVTVRNRIVSGEWILLSYQGGINLWIGNNPEADGMSARLPGFSSWRNEDVQAVLAREYGRSVSPREQDAHYRRLALEYLGSEPGRAIGLLARKAYFFLQGYEIRNNRDLYALRDRNVLLRLPGPDFAWVGPLAALGIVVGWRRRRELAAIHGYALALAASVVVFFVCSRYRLPAWPALLVLAGAGVGGLLDPAIERKTRLVRAALLIAFALLARIDFLSVRNPDPAPTHLQYGNVYARAGEDETAEREFREALRLSPGLAEGRYHLGALLLRQGRIREALPELRAAAGGLPSSFRVRRSLGEALEHAGRTSEAIVVRREAADLSAGSAEDVLSLANSLGMGGQYAEAWHLYRQLAERGLESDPYFLLNAGQTALALKRYDDVGLEYLRRAAAFPEVRLAAFESAARYLLSMRRPEEALRVLADAHLVTKENASLHRLRAVARLATGDMTGAVQDMESVLRLEPTDVETRRKLEEIRASSPR